MPVVLLHSHLHAAQAGWWCHLGCRLVVLKHIRKIHTKKCHHATCTYPWMCTPLLAQPLKEKENLIVFLSHFSPISSIALDCTYTDISTAHCLFIPHTGSLYFEDSKPQKKKQKKNHIHIFTTCLATVQIMQRPAGHTLPAGRLRANSVFRLSGVCRGCEGWLVIFYQASWWRISEGWKNPNAGRLTNTLDWLHLALVIHRPAIWQPSHTPYILITAPPNVKSLQ